MIHVVTWKWRAPGGPDFGPEYVNRLRAGLERHLHLDHELVCITDDERGIDRRVRIVAMPTTYAETPRCRRRIQIHSWDFARAIGHRILQIDLDVVIVGDITPIVDRPEPLVCYRIGYAGVFAGAFVLTDAGHLDGLWQRFEADPYGYPKQCSGERVPSDQAMLNAYLKKRAAAGLVPHWTDADGFVLYFGKGYERQEHLGVGPNQPNLPAGARIVLLGGADKADMDAAEAPWLQEHWASLPAEAGA